MLNSKGVEQYVMSENSDLKIFKERFLGVSIRYNCVSSPFISLTLQPLPIISHSLLQPLPHHQNFEHYNRNRG